MATIISLQRDRITPIAPPQSPQTAGDPTRLLEVTTSQMLVDLQPWLDTFFAMRTTPNQVRIIRKCPYQVRAISWGEPCLEADTLKNPLRKRNSPTEVGRKLEAAKLQTSVSVWDYAATQNKLLRPQPSA